jgi:hypothetical protein
MARPMASRCRLRAVVANPNRAHQLLTMMTPNDPTDAEWSEVSTIVCQVVAAKLNGMRLRTWSLPREMVNATMAVAKITTKALTFDLGS